MDRDRVRGVVLGLGVGDHLAVAVEAAVQASVGPVAREREAAPEDAARLPRDNDPAVAPDRNIQADVRREETDVCQEQAVAVEAGVKAPVR